MDQKKPQILFISRWYPNKEDSMAGLFVKRHAQAIAYYAQVYVLYVHSIANKKKVFKGWDYSHSNGLHELKIYYSGASKKVPANQIINGILYLFYLTRGFFWLKTRIGKFQIVHVNILTRAGILALLLKIFAGLPYLITEHWSRYLPITNTYKGLLRKSITRKVVKNAEAITVVTENLKNAMQRHGLHHKKFYIVPNVVNTNIFKPSSLNLSSKKFLHVSCFEDKSKNISGLLRATQRLSQLRHDFKLILVGDGQDFQQIQEYSKTLHLEPYVIFTGLIEEEEQLAEYYRQSCCMVMFSNYENMPVVINESLACGKPVIATRVGGIAEIIDSNKGILIEPGDEDSLCEAMNFMLDHATDYDARALRDYAVENFSFSRVGKRFFEIYQEIIPIE